MPVDNARPPPGFKKLPTSLRTKENNKNIEKKDIGFYSSRSFKKFWSHGIKKGRIETNLPSSITVVSRRNIECPTISTSSLVSYS